MTMWFAALLLIPAADQAIKVWLRHALGSNAVRLGPLVSLRIVTTRVWWHRFGPSSLARMWLIWAISAASLIGLSAAIPPVRVFAGVLLAGSLSHVLETTWRGSISDYICSRWWPAFNLADVAITIGAIGVVARASIALVSRSV